MIIDGRKISYEIQKEVQQELKGNNTSLGIIYLGSNPVIDNFIKIKKKFGEEIGIPVVVYKFKSITEKDVKKIADQHPGIIIQLPIPGNLSTSEILNFIPDNKDIDVLSKKSVALFENGKLSILPPVVGAIVEIFNRHNIKIKNKKVVIVGKGKLVGKPISIWFQLQGINPIILEEGDDIIKSIKIADIIISGVGEPNLIKPEMIKKGVILIDAGTSESNGKIKGDADPACAEKCSLFTPVPGGVGPIVVATLFKNLVFYAKKIKTL